MFAKVILASRPTNNAPPIVTIHAHYPRPIHGEVMTHRVFSRNARSSRAVPVATMLKEIRETPFVPWHWGKNQKGMQATEENDEPIISKQFTLEPVDGMYFEELTALEHDEAWRRAANQAADWAEGFSKAGYHKQIANRLIEPFSFIDTLITSTSWANFFHLRDHKDAEPHFHDLAAMIRTAIDEAEYQTLEPGQWHLPFANREEDVAAIEDYLEPYPETTHSTVDYLKRLSVARCARISYKPFDGDASIEKELERYELLVGSTPLHASPAEHQATPDTLDNYPGAEWDNPYLAGNLGPGWIQYRKTLFGEFVQEAA